MMRVALLYVRMLFLITAISRTLLFSQADDEGTMDLFTILVSGEGLRGNSDTASIIAPQMMDAVFTVTIISKSDKPVRIAGPQFFHALECRIIDERTGVILYELRHLPPIGLQPIIELRKDVPLCFSAPMRTLLPNTVFRNDGENPMPVRLSLTLMGRGGATVASTDRRLLVFTDVNQWERYSTASMHAYRRDPALAMTVVNILASHADGERTLIRNLSGLSPRGESFTAVRSYLEVAIRARNRSFISQFIGYLADQHLPQDQINAFKAIILGVAAYDATLFEELKENAAFSGIQSVAQID